ncbi:MAG: hypothetical protein ACJ768_09160 [Gaiellaceae bacterium]
MNEEIRRLAESYAVVDDLDLVCECETDDCFAPLSVSPAEYQAVRTSPTHFLVKRDHVSADERILEEGAHYVVVEKIAVGVEQPA